MSKDLVNLIKESEKQGTTGYDTQAEVLRVEGNTAWVHIPGGVQETPVNLTIAAKAGDLVQVRVAGGNAWLVGNASAPPTDDGTAIIANNRAKTAQKKAQTAEDIAKDALRIAKEGGDEAQFFWHVETGTDTGAHITEIPREDFLQNPDGGNILVRSNGLVLRDALVELAKIIRDEYGDVEIALGLSGGAQVLIDSTGVALIDENGNVITQIANGITSSVQFRSTDYSASSGTFGTWIQDMKIWQEMTRLGFKSEMEPGYLKLTGDGDVRPNLIIDNGTWTSDLAKIRIYPLVGNVNFGNNGTKFEFWGNATNKLAIRFTNSDDNKAFTLYAKADSLQLYNTTDATEVWRISGKIGTTKNKETSADVSVPTSTIKNLTNISLEAGTWLVIGTAEFANNTSGRRAAQLSTTSTGEALQKTARDVRLPVSGAKTLLTFTTILTPTATTTYYLNAWQNSGGALATGGRIDAVRIK